jgi:hypothetical protein
MFRLNTDITFQRYTSVDGQDTLLFEKMASTWK